MLRGKRLIECHELVAHGRRVATRQPCSAHILVLTTTMSASGLSTALEPNAGGAPSCIRRANEHMLHNRFVVLSTTLCAAAYNPPSLVLALAEAEKVSDRSKVKEPVLT